MPQKKKRPAFSSPLTKTHVEQKDKDDDGDDHDNDVTTPKTRATKTKKQNDPNKKRNDAKRARLQAEEEEEKRLTELMFGGNVNTTAAWNDDDDNDGDEENADNNTMNNTDTLFEIDRGGDRGSDSDSDDDDEPSDDDRDSDSDDSEEGENKTSSSAWVDEDDANLTVSLNKSNRVKKLRKFRAEDVIQGSSYEQRLREKFEATATATSRTDWATLPKDGSGAGAGTGGLLDDDDDGELDNDRNSSSTAANLLLSSTAPLLSNKRLQPNFIDILRCPDANIGHTSQCTIQSVHFNPASDPEQPIMLTAGLDRSLRFFRINGSSAKKSEKIHGVHFPNLPIHSAQFLGNTGKVVVSGRRPFFYIYDSNSGKIDKVPSILGRQEKSLEQLATSPDGSLIAFVGNDGYILLIETKTKMFVAEFKMNGSVRGLSFSQDGNYILSCGSDGEVYRWDIRSKRCVDRFQNEDGTIASRVSVTSRFLAVGAESGVVNLYNEKASASPFSTSKKSPPLKSIMNMKTSVDYMKFNPDGNILAFSSRREKDSLKLLHVPTQTIFSNWPSSNTPLGYVWSLDFSPESKFMAIGNDKGKCLLYKLKHYDDNY